MEDKVTLYIATHNITGKKYFGKTCKWFTQKDLQENYNGSGKHWNRHKNKHGKKRCYYVNLPNMFIKRIG